MLLLAFFGIGHNLPAMAEEKKSIRKSPRSTNGAEVGLLWLSLVVGMTLHFTYSVSGMKYGIPFVDEGATGQVPWSNFAMKSTFYVVPFLFAVGSTGNPGRLLRRVHFIVACLFVLPNLAHLVGTIGAAKAPLDFAQMLLLTALLLANLQLVRLTRLWLKSAPSPSASEAPQDAG